MVTKTESGPIVIEPVQTGTMTCALIGTRPLIMNAMSEKVRQELILPKGRKTTAEKQANLKHNPLEEYQNSVYTIRDESCLLGVMSSAIKGAMMTAALDMPGTRKAQIGRLVYVMGDYTPVYGVPQMFMSVTRSADINHTPDVRTRAIVPEWAALVTIQYVQPLLNATGVLNLLNAGGMTAGIGDWRPQKGAGTYGQFRIGNADDPVLARLQAQGGRAAQEAAMQEPSWYDDDTERLYTWCVAEAKRRGR